MREVTVYAQNFKMKKTQLVIYFISWCFQLAPRRYYGRQEIIF